MIPVRPSANSRLAALQALRPALVAAKDKAERELKECNEAIKSELASKLPDNATELLEHALRAGADEVVAKPILESLSLQMPAKGDVEALRLSPSTVQRLDQTKLKAEQPAIWVAYSPWALQWTLRKVKG